MVSLICIYKASLTLFSLVWFVFVSLETLFVLFITFFQNLVLTL